MTATYDDNNIFARILRNEIPNNTVLEDEHVLSFHVISPQRPVHALVIPKAAYADLTSFAETASDAEIVAFVRALGKVARATGVADDGYRIICNTGENGHQEVPHLHFHIVGGGSTGPMLRRQDS